jgi:hypothetical protein
MPRFQFGAQLADSLADDFEVPDDSVLNKLTRHEFRFGLVGQVPIDPGDGVTDMA